MANWHSNTIIVETDAETHANIIAFLRAALKEEGYILDNDLIDDTYENHIYFRTMYGTPCLHIMERLSSLYPDTAFTYTHFNPYVAGYDYTRKYLNGICIETIEEDFFSDVCAE